MGRLRSTTFWLVSLAWVAAAAPAARAQNNPQQAVEELNRQALEAYNALDINKAGSLLEQALRISAQGGVAPALIARTNLNLGVVYVGGLNDQNNGANYLMQAVCMDPSVQLDPLNSSPEIQNVFNTAVQRARSGGCGGAPGGPAPAPPAGYGAPPSGYGAPPYGAAPYGAAPYAPQAPAPYVPPPPPPPPPPDQAIAHTAPPEQLSQTPLPLYAEISPLAQAKKIFLFYKGLGMKQPKRVPMYRYQGGYAYQISCADVWEPKLSYYIEAQAADGRIVGVVGSAARPIDVAVVPTRKQAEPALPGAQPPTTCIAKECPPGVQGCKRAGGKAAIGDSCSGSSDCQGGLECHDDACMLIGAGGTEVPDYDATTGGYAEGSVSESVDSGKPGPNFVQLGLTAGLAYVQAGMPADRAPPSGRVFLIDGSVPPTFADDAAAALAAGQMIRFAEPGTPTDSKLTAWVPDSDSADSVGPLKGNCAADGKASGPSLPRLLPSKYCVRVKTPGFVPNFAVRAAFGHFFTPKIALVGLLRAQPVSGIGGLSHFLIGARAEYLLSEQKAKGLVSSAFAGLTLGELRAKPPASGTTSGAPFAKSGPLGVHVGANFRYRLSSHFGLYASPELDVQLPTFLLNIDLTLAGAEYVF